MKRIISILLALALVLSFTLVMAAQTAMPVLAASMHEYYNTGDDGFGGINGSTWRAQTFTPSVAHTITSVKLLIYRQGTPGTITVSIRATSGGLPTGPDLCSGTTAGNTLPTGSPYEWREVTFTSGYDLSAGTQYAIVARATGGDSSNRGLWRNDSSSPAYAGGESTGSTDSGSSWFSIPADYMFEEWGDPLGAGGAVGWETYPVSKVRVLLPWIALLAALVAGVSLVVLRRRRAQT